MVSIFYIRDGSSRRRVNKVGHTLFLVVPETGLVSALHESVLALHPMELSVPRCLVTSFSLGVSGLSFASPYHPCAKTYLLSLVPFQVHLWCLLFLPHPLWKCPPVILLAALQGFPVSLELRNLPPIHCPLTLCLAHWVLHMSLVVGRFV